MAAERTVARVSEVNTGLIIVFADALPIEQNGRGTLTLGETPISLFLMPLIVSRKSELARAYPTSISLRKSRYGEISGMICHIHKRHASQFYHACLACCVAAILSILVQVVRAEQPPGRSGYLNVRDFGAKGDGHNDDTFAIRAAISKLPPFDIKHPFRAQPIYFPDGVYLVSDTISRVDDQGRFQPALVLLGQSKEKTIIRLADHAPGFEDRRSSKAVLYFSSGLLGGSPGAGGKHYPDKGEGNDAYQNCMENLAVDVGEGNAGAIAIDYLANNVGALRRINVIGRPGSGHTGISLRRKWIGPALLSDISISDFDFGIAVENTEYGVVLDRISITKARAAGLRNFSNLISFSELSIGVDGGFGIANLGPQSLMVGRKGTIYGKGRVAIQNQGYMNLEDVETSSFQPLFAKDRTQRVEGVFNPTGRVEATRWKLPVPPTPFPSEPDDNDWADVTAYGASSDPSVDSTAGITAALGSGKSAVYFPNGTYTVTSQIVIPRTVARLEGTWSSVNLDMRRRNGESAPVISIAARDQPLLIRRFVFENTRGSAKTLILDASRGALLLQDVVAGGIKLLERSASGGEVFLENIAFSAIEIAGPAGAWIRQLNTEGAGVRIANRGAPLWILGSKTEQNMTFLENTDGATTEIHGGFVYMVHFKEPRRPYLVNRNGTIAAALAEEAFVPDAAYTVFLESTTSERKIQILGADLPVRHHVGRIAPQITTEP